MAGTPGLGAPIARLALAFPGLAVEKWATWGAGWSTRADLQACATCGASTIQMNPDGEPDHFRHYQNDGKPATS